jgi:hypothetical protein
MAAWSNTPSRSENISREQHSDSTVPRNQERANDTVTITQSNNDSNAIVTNIRTPKLYSCDPKVTNNDIENHLNNINQNTTGTITIS